MPCIQQVLLAREFSFNAAASSLCERCAPLPLSAMPVIGIINRKGGSGKTTLATHVAAWLSRRGDSVMLGDVDRQQSAVPWIKRRQARAPGGAPLVGWAVDARNVLRPPVGVRHIVLDTPGGLHGFDLSRLLMNVHVVLMPVCDSVFDRESASDCLAELRMHPRVASGRVVVAVVGMRLDPDPRAQERLREWARERGVPLVGALQEGRAYALVAEQGLTLFDRTPSKVQPELAQWDSVVGWLNETLIAVSATLPGSVRSGEAAPALAPLPASIAAPMAAEPPAATAAAQAMTAVPESTEVPSCFVDIDAVASDGVSRLPPGSPSPQAKLANTPPAVALRTRAAVTPGHRAHGGSGLGVGGLPAGGLHAGDAAVRLAAKAGAPSSASPPSPQAGVLGRTRGELGPAPPAQRLRLWLSRLLPGPRPAQLSQFGR